MKKEEFISGEFYHIFNRGVEKRNIFTADTDYERFLAAMKYFNSTDPAWKIDWLKQKGKPPESGPIVEIVSYCLNPNHYHLLLKQVEDGGISHYLRRIGIGYTMYFNKRYERSGFLFQGTFKSSHISSGDHLKYLSAYINYNSEVHGICDAEKYKWSSLKSFISGGGNLCHPENVLKQFQNPKAYTEFAKKNAKIIAEERRTEKLLLE